MTSFKQSIIIPLSLFEKCNFSGEPPTERDPPPTTESKPADILHDPKLAVDTKMKLYSQKKKFHIDKKRRPYPVIIDTPKKVSIISKKNDISAIRDLFSTGDQPIINSILENILDNPSKISWDEKYQIIIDGIPIHESSLIDLLKYVRNETVITSDEDVPIGAAKFIHVLDQIKIPRSWLKIPRRSRRNQIASWISYRDGI